MEGQHRSGTDSEGQATDRKGSRALAWQAAPGLGKARSAVGPDRTGMAWQQRTGLERIGNARNVKGMERTGMAASDNQGLAYDRLGMARST